MLSVVKLYGLVCPPRPGVSASPDLVCLGIGTGQEKATMDSEVFGHGKGYKYAHEFKDHYVKQEYKPSDVKYYFPTDMGYEKKIKEWLEKLKNNE